MSDQDDYNLITRFKHFQDELPGVPTEVIATLIVADVVKLCHNELEMISMVVFDCFADTPIGPESDFGEDKEP